MKLLRRWSCVSRSVILVVAMVAAAPSTIGAQTLGGPYANLFGRKPDRTGKEWSAIDFRASVGGKYDDFLFVDVPTDEQDGNFVDPAAGGYGAGAVGTLGLERHTKVSDLLVQGSATYQDYLTVARSVDATSFGAGLEYRVKVTDRVTAETSGSFIRQPFFQLLPPALSEDPEWMLPVPSTPYAALLRSNDSLEGRAQLGYRTGRRSSFSAGITGRKVKFEEGFSAGDFETIGGNAAWQYQISRGLGIHVGYERDRYRTREVAASEYVHEHIDVGVDFAREISIARRTSLSFSTRTSVVRDNTQRRFRLDGNINLSKWFRRTWHASIGAQRSTDFVPGVFQPVFSDTAVASIGGMLASRVEWFTVFGGGQGMYGFANAIGTKFRTATASSRLSFALTRRLGTYVQYSLFHYEVPRVGLLGIIDSQQLTRQSVVAGFNVWVPVYSRERAPSGSQ